MRIANNIMAMNTYRQYTVNNDNVAKSAEKLSSGYRINRAGDDAAGLAISEKMRAQVRGLNMAAKNSQDAISLVQTAEGALTETHSILQRMRELAVQSSSDTNQNLVDRPALDQEFQALKGEIDDIANKTAFNGKKLLDGTFGTSSAVDNAASELQLHAAGISDIQFEGFSAGAHSISFTDLAGGSTTATLEAGATDPVYTAQNIADGAQTITLDFGSSGKITIKTAANFVAANTFDAANTLDFTVANTGAFIQTGANTGDQLAISIGKMDSAALGLNVASANLLTQGDSSLSIDTVDAAVNTVSSQRAALGAIQNRLEHKINNLNTSSENLSAAESRIRDVDIAKEMTNFTKNNILSQAATAMLAQANSAPQNVLSLLK